jgi:hypothetical protein
VTIYGPQHDALQPPGEHDSHNDSVYFNLTPASGVAGAIVRIGMRPNEGYSEASVVIPKGDGTVVFEYSRHPLDTDSFPVGSPRWESGALALEAVEPGRRWRISYRGGGTRVVMDPLGFAERPGEIWRASPQLECEFELEWEAEFPVHVLSAEGNLMPGDDEVAYARDHYEQFGRVDGVLRLGQAEHRIEAAPSFRDHSWGPRVWESAPDQDFVTVYLDDGRRAVAVASRSDGREHAHGVIWVPGADAPVQIERYEIRSGYAGGPSPGDAIGWTFEGEGQTIEIEGDVIGFMPLRVGKRAVRIAQTIVRLGVELPGHAKTDLTRPIAATERA